MSIYPSFEELIGAIDRQPSQICRSLYMNRAQYDEQDNSIFRFQLFGQLTTFGGEISTIVPTTSLSSRDLIEATDGVREIEVSKDIHGRVGLRLQGMDCGVFITYVEADSPAARANLHFGDQVLKIHNQLTAGYTGTRAMALIREGPPRNMLLVIRPSPLVREITLTKNSQGDIGIKVYDGKISSVVKDSSAALKGVLTNYHLLEVNGINVIGLKNDVVQGLIFGIRSNTVRITVTPSFFYKRLVKRFGLHLFRNMDGSGPVA